MTRTLTPTERRKLGRLLAQARKSRRRLDVIQAAVVAITGDPLPEFGHSFDAVWLGLGDTPGKLLGRLQGEDQ